MPDGGDRGPPDQASCFRGGDVEPPLLVGDERLLRAHVAQRPRGRRNLAKALFPRYNRYPRPTREEP